MTHWSVTIKSIVKRLTRLHFVIFCFFVTILLAFRSATVTRLSSFCARLEATSTSWPYNWSMLETRKLPNASLNTNNGTLLDLRWLLQTYLQENTEAESRMTAKMHGECEIFKKSPELSCDAECVRFRELLWTWPRDKPKAAIYFLAQLSTLGLLQNAILLLDKHFNSDFNYPIIIFSDDSEMNEAAARQIRLVTNSTVFFQRVEFEIPMYVQRDLVPKDVCGKKIGYRHMCRFHAKGVYDQPILTGLEYALRLDDDSKVLRPINYDIFLKMRTNGLLYGYVTETSDSPACVQWLWEVSCRYVGREAVKAQFFSRWTQNKMYYNNFEVSALSLWRSCEYQYYIDYIDRLGGIYYIRWGDAPIKSIAVSLFVPENKLYHFSDIGYEHQHIKRP